MPVHETVLLESMKPDDASALFQLVDANREQLAKFWWEATTKSAVDSARFIEAAHADEQYSGRSTRGIYVPDRRLIGVGSVHSIEWELGRGALGYWIDKEEYGHGFATQTAKELSRLAFTQLGLRVVTISCRTDNRASRAVAEHAGFELVGSDKHQTWRKQTIEPTEVAHYELRAS